MSLEELIAQADERGLAVSGVACLDRCVPLLGGDDEALRPLWGTLAEGPDDGDWGEALRQTREKLDAAAGEAAGGCAGEAAELARGMLATAPLDRSGRRCGSGPTAARTARCGSICCWTARATWIWTPPAGRDAPTGCRRCSPRNCGGRPPSSNSSPPTGRPGCAARWRCPRRDAGCCARRSRAAAAGMPDTLSKVRVEDMRRRPCEHPGAVVHPLWKAAGSG